MGGPDPVAAGGGASLGGPMASPDGGTRFRRSVNLQRANDAMGAATFAARAPLPMSQKPAAPSTPEPGEQMAMDPTSLLTTAPAPAESAASPAPPALGGPSVSPPGEMQYSGAYGTGPEAQKLAEGARAAYIAKHLTIANAQDFGNGTNYFQNLGLQNEANDRANAQAAAKVASEAAYADEHGAHAEAARTWARENAPAAAAETRAGASLKNAEAYKMRSDTDLISPQKGYALRMEGNAAAAKGKAAEDYGRAALTSADHKDEMGQLKSQHREAMGMIRELLTAQGKGSLADRMIASLGGETSTQPAPATAPPTTAATTQPSSAGVPKAGQPEGSRAKTTDGREMVVRNGQWVPL